MTDEDLQEEAEMAERVISETIPDLASRLPVLLQLVESADYAERVAPAAWGVTLLEKGFRLNVGRVEVLVFVDATVRLNCIGEEGHPPFTGQYFESPGYRSVPDPKCAFVGPIPEFAIVREHLQPSHQKFIETVGRKKSGEPISGSRYRNSHCEGLLVYARKYIASSSVVDNIEAYVTTDDELLAEDTLAEGKRLSVLVNRYERNATARARCIAHHGPVCVICRFSSASVYGEGVPGLIHVHHIRPLSEIAEEYVVDPIADLRPVCPNCHAVIHSRRPQYEIEEVEAMLRRPKTKR